MASTALGVLGGNALTSGLSSGFRSAVDAGIGFNAMLEGAQNAFTTLLGSSDAAQKHLAELVAFAAKTPFDLAGVLQGSKLLLAFGFNVQSVIPWLTTLGDTAAALNLGQGGIDQLVRVIGQMKNSGRVLQGDLNQLQQAGVDTNAVFVIMAAQMGKTVPQLKKMQEAGKLPSSAFLAAFQQFANSKFGGMMAKQASTFTGIWENVRDTLRMTFGRIFSPLFEQLKQIGQDILNLTGSSTWEEWTAKIQGVVGRVMTVFGAFRAQWGGLMAAHGVGFFQAGLIAIELLIGRTFGPGAQAAFHGFLELIARIPGVFGQVVSFLGGTVLPILGQLAAFLANQFPAVWAGITQAVLFAATTVWPQLVAAVQAGQAVWTNLQPTLAGAWAQLQTFWTNLQPFAAWLLTNLTPILAGVGAAMAVMFSPAVLGIALGLIGAIAGALLTLMGPLALLGILVGVFTAAWVGNWGGIRDVVMSAWSHIQPVLAAIGGWLAKAGEFIGKVLGKDVTLGTLINPTTAVATALESPNVQTGLGIAASAGAETASGHAGTVNFGGVTVNASDPADVNAFFRKLLTAQGRAETLASPALIGAA